MNGTVWAVAAALALGGAVSDIPTNPQDLPAPTDRQIAASLQRWGTDDQLRRSVQRWSVDGSVQRLVEESTSSSGTTLTLLSDILFDFGKSTIGASARDAIEERAEDIPKGAKVSVDGHTDSIGSTSANRKLSRERAQAVARILAKARPDLDLTATGHGDSDPVADNTVDGEDNPEGRQQNRRVEISYED